MHAVQLLQRKASAVLDAAVDRVDRVTASAPATPNRRPPDAGPPTPQPLHSAGSAAGAGGDGAAASPDLSRVPKSDVIALCVKTGRRLQAVEMQYAQLKAMHQVGGPSAPPARRS